MSLAVVALHDLVFVVQQLLFCKLRFFIQVLILQGAELTRDGIFKQLNVNKIAKNKCD